MLFFLFKTWLDVSPITPSLRTITAEAQTLQVTDRHGYPLTISYQNRWNTYDNLPLYQVPDFLKEAFIFSEDQHFYTHRGIDWRARLSALWQNMRADRAVRGASTMSEQVVRMIHPRPRNLWSKWIESFEVLSLERHLKKSDILEFYLNQLPYAANRRGVLQAAHYYFNRDLSTLSHKEMLALVVLARAPSNFDLYQSTDKINTAIMRLAKSLNQQDLLSTTELSEIEQQTLTLDASNLSVNAGHFVGFIRNHQTLTNQALKTTLDANLQQHIQAMIDERVKSLSAKNVHNAAVVVVDHITGEILAWVVGGANNEHTHQIDAVTAPRQPGSALKPFLYTLALESGWTPATLIDDSPLSSAIGTGLHRFKNYSNTYYGKISLREALGNSLNIPALRTIQFVGVSRYLDTLHSLGFSSLDRAASIYDEGLALGNGEVTLLELVTGYAALANHGMYRPLHFLLSTPNDQPPKRIFSDEGSSLIANILSDSWARRLEFGTNSVMNMPVQTAVKTGTSSDYRDAWVVGFNYRYVVGIWMGNLDRTPMDGVTGSVGPALVMRGIFSKLNQGQKTAPLYLSPKLVRKEMCAPAEEAACLMRTEYFIPALTENSVLKGERYINGTEGDDQKNILQPSKIILVQPTEGLQIAMDPRIPKDKQKLVFEITGLQSGDTVDWMLNDENIAHTETGQYLWPLQRGQHKLGVVMKRDGKIVQQISEVGFVVK
jgi:penicillin-binding protein 1C